ncbi:hypothetical protein A3Q56_07640, partial [Intoshia linei]
MYQSNTMGTNTKKCKIIQRILSRKGKKVHIVLKIDKPNTMQKIIKTGCFKKKKVEVPSRSQLSPNCPNFIPCAYISDNIIFDNHTWRLQLDSNRHGSVSACIILQTESPQIRIKLSYICTILTINQLDDYLQIFHENHPQKVVPPHLSGSCYFSGTHTHCSIGDFFSFNNYKSYFNSDIPFDLFITLVFYNVSTRFRE